MNASDQQGILSDLIASWHQWAAGEQASRGYSNTAAGFSLYRTSRQHDDGNGSLDAECDKSTMRTIDFQVSQMQDPYRAAIHMNAKNLAAGRDVFRSPRLPVGIEGAEVLRVARATLILRLVNAGVI